MGILEFFAEENLCKADGSGLCTEDMSFDSFIPGFFGNITNVLFTIAGVVCVVMIVVCGFMLMTSAGDPGKIAKAKKGLIGAIIGLIISLSALVIVKSIGSIVSK